MGLNAIDLAALSREARQCFLFEEAPDCLALLEEGVQTLCFSPSPASPSQYTAIVRAAHSLKGGAGLAQLPVLSQLSHHLEDLLEALQQGQVQDVATAYELLTLGTEQVRTLIANASHDQDEPALESLPIVALLAEFLAAQEPTDAVIEVAEPSGADSLVSIALTVDLEDCLQRVEAQLGASESTLLDTLTDFLEEGQLLGEALELDGLTQIIAQMGRELHASPVALTEWTITRIAEIRQWRQRALTAAQSAPARLTTPDIPVDAAAGLAMIAELEAVDRATDAAIERTVTDTELMAIAPPASLDAPVPEAGPLGEDTATAPVPLLGTPEASKTEPVTTAAHLSLRMPFTKVDRMGNTVGELLINHERLSLCQSQLRQIGLELKRRADHLTPLQDQVQTFYDALATTWINTGGPTPENPEHEEFDSLQFDRYTDFHSTLQSLQELMLRIHETRSDIDLVHQELQEALDQSRQYLNGLGQDLHQSRLVPFKQLAQKFMPALQGLNQQYQKSVELKIIGENTLIDQLLVEQLRTPLTHLFRNAFDHGIEPVQERQLLEKPETATIQLSAKVQGNQVVIAIADDGRGIDTVKVGQRALEAGLCTRADLHTLSRNQILDFLFTPGFSTAKEVTSLSGRGVGLDVVRLHVERLRGSIRIETALGEGTQFLLSVPLTISILPLLLCQCETLTLALPSASIREIIHLAEYFDQPTFPQSIEWHGQSVEVIPLRWLLPYHQHGLTASVVDLPPPLAVVVEMDDHYLGVAVDSLLAEKELVLKPFDRTVPVPPYVTGCTVLGTGEVVPILAPNHFQPLVTAYHQAAQDDSADLAQWEQSMDPTILIVDDSIAVRHLLGEVLTQSGYQVVDCRDGKEALKRLNQVQHHVDLVISDVEMPQLDGYTLLKEIRSHPRWFGVPVAMLTSRTSDQHRQKAMSLGASAYMKKPFQPTEMLETVQTLLSLEMGEAIEF